MTLKQYIDNINTSLIKFGLTRNPFPRKYMVHKINEMRRYISSVTRCLECWNTADSVDGQAQYTVPEDCIEIFDVWYDGLLLDRKNPDQMNYFRETTPEEGVPTLWSRYGGTNQTAGFLYLYVTPDTNALVIKLHTLQLAVPLMDDTDTCELPLNLQFLVEEGVKLKIKMDQPRTDVRLPIYWANFMRDLHGNTSTRVL